MLFAEGLLIEAPLQMSHRFSSGTFKVSGSLPLREAPGMSFSCNFVDTRAVL